MSFLELHCDLTDAIVELLEEKIPPSRALWNPKQGCSAVRPLRANGEPYRGGNLLKLALMGNRRGYLSPYWITANQAEKLGAEICPGELATNIFYCGMRDRIIKKTDGSQVETTTYFERRYEVFNADQCRGLPLPFHGAFQPPRAFPQVAAKSAHFFRAVGAKVKHGSPNAYYAPIDDVIVMPQPEAFIDLEAYESVLCHEHIHWTGHISRLNRLKGTRFGDPAYAREELVAELGAAFLCMELGITPAIRDDHIAYLDSWLEILLHDRRAIYVAASRASDAVDFLHSYQVQIAC